MDYTGQLKELLREIRREYRYTAGFTGRPQPSEQVLAALAKVERHRFVPAGLVQYAYENHPLPIGHGQTISQPYIVALMTDFLDLKATDTVLEIGTGCGYQTAVLALLAHRVYSLEIIESLAGAAAERLAGLGYDNIEIRSGDGNRGWPDKAPFNGIMVTAAAEQIPPALFGQLAPNGRMVIPLGAQGQNQQLYLITRSPRGVMQKRLLLDVAFVPLVSAVDYDNAA